MGASSCGTFQGSTRLFLLRERFTDCPVNPPKSSARYDLAVVVSRPVSIFLRVLTGFFIFRPTARQLFPIDRASL